MFALVKFVNGEFYITKFSQLTIETRNSCLVKYKGGTKYAATLICRDDSENTLLQRQNEMANDIQFGIKENDFDVEINDAAFDQPRSLRARKSSNLFTVKEQKTGIRKQHGEDTAIEIGKRGEISDISAETMEANPQPECDSDNKQREENEISAENLSNPLQPECNENHIEEVIGNQGISFTSDPSYAPDFNISAETPQNSRNISMASSRISDNTSYRSTDLSSIEPNIDIRNIIVPKSKHGTKRTSKKDFCLYCKKLVTQFSRHLKKLHQDENEVKLFMHYPEKSQHRNAIIKKIRGKGNFLHNTNAEYNTGILITCRQQQSKSKNSAEDYIVCTNCKASYSKRTIRIHYRKCNPSHKKGIREVTTMGRQMSSYVHTRANNVVKKIIIPGMHDDDITRSIKYDELIIIAANKFSDKYTMDQHIDLIRGHLRLLGRLKLAIMARNENIKNFASIFHPINYDVVVEGVREVARYNPNTRTYGAPSNATTLGTLIKKCSNMLIAECIKTQNTKTKKDVENFMILYEDDYPTTINKKVLETQISRKRDKKEILPTKDDINKLYSYLKTICKEATFKLEKKFDIDDWKNLSEACLILLQMFNRRRSGEIERLLITDYKQQESVNENISPELFLKLSERSQILAKKYVRVTIRGKLNRTVPVLLDSDLVQWINLILKKRSNAGVHLNNKYVFGVPFKNKMAKNYIRACPLMRKFSEACGADMPKSLRGTKLRKHIATYTAMLGVEETQIDNLANFMGHNKQIHKDIYRIPVPFRDVTDVSQLLMAAMGIDDDDEVASDTESEASVQDNTTRTVAKYVADISSSDSSAIASDGSSLPKKRRSTSPFGKTRRQRWTDAEKEVIHEHFGNCSELKILPTLAQCSQAIEKYPVLHRRKPQTVKTWIDNQRKASERKLIKNLN